MTILAIADSRCSERIDEAAEITARENIDHLYVALPPDQHLRMIELLGIEALPRGLQPRSRDGPGPMTAVALVELILGFLLCYAALGVAVLFVVAPRRPASLLDRRATPGGRPRRLARRSWAHGPLPPSNYC